MPDQAIRIMVAVVVVCSPALAIADGMAARDVRAKTGAEKVGTDAAVADPRLPPVFPGEEVRDGDKVIKMWSTSGPVSVAQPPEPWATRPGSAMVNGVGGGVIVDARRDHLSKVGQDDAHH